MDFLSGLAKKATSDEPKPTTDSPAPAEHKPTNSDLTASAKIVAESAQAQFRNQEFDKKKTAGATADLLSAAETYGKLDETKGAGKYVDQAEDYLRKFAGDAPKPAEGKPEAAAAAPEVKEPEKKPEGEGGAGDYMKTAGDFLKK